MKTFSRKVVRQSRIAKKGQTLAHIRYITRDAAARTVLAERLPEEEFSETASKVEQAAEKSGGRVCERFTIALPVEANLEQREALLRAYAEHITRGSAGYIGAIHDKSGNDLLNPHAHLICFDAFTRKGGRGRPTSVLGMARKHAVENAAEDWATVHNRMMSGWGFGPDSMIDHRSYAERGIDQMPTIHEGPAAQKMGLAKQRLVLKPEWRHIDHGHTRAQANQVIREINKTKGELDGKRADRLGGDDDANANRSKGGVPWLGKGSGSNISDGGAAAGKHYQSQTEPRYAGPDFGGLTGRSNGTEGADKGSSTTCLTRHPASAAARHSSSLPRRWHRIRSMRRTFRDLVMYRDTLQARLLRSRAPRQILETSKALTSEKPITRLPPQLTR